MIVFCGLLFYVVYLLSLRVVFCSFIRFGAYILFIVVLFEGVLSLFVELVYLDHLYLLSLLPQFSLVLSFVSVVSSFASLHFVFCVCLVNI